MSTEVRRFRDNDIALVILHKGSEHGLSIYGVNDNLRIPLTTGLCTSGVDYKRRTPCCPMVITDLEDLRRVGTIRTAGYAAILCIQHVDVTESVRGNGRFPFILDIETEASLRCKTTGTRRGNGGRLVRRRIDVCGEYLSFTNLCLSLKDPFVIKLRSWQDHDDQAHSHENKQNYEQQTRRIQSLHGSSIIRWD